MVNATETILDGNSERYEQRYSISLGWGEMRFVRRPVCVVPSDGTVCFVDDGPRLGTMRQQCADLFKNGIWMRVRFEPTHWTHREDKPNGE